MFCDLGPSALLSPAPAVMVTCRGKEGVYDKDNIVTVAWAGTVCSDPPCVSVSLRPSRFSYIQIMQTGEFAVNFVGEDLLWACDFCGVRSGRDIDKFEKTALAPKKVPELVYAPVIESAPAALCCKVVHTLELGSHTQFIGQVLDVKVQSDLLDENGKLHLEKANLIAYSHGDYCRLGKKLGFFGYSVAGKSALERRMKQ